MKLPDTISCSCPTCGMELNAAAAAGVSEFENKAPRQNDFALCFGCAELLIFCEGPGLRKATKEDLSRFSKEGLNYLKRIRDDLINHLISDNKID